MKYIIAIVQPDKLEQVREALGNAGAVGVTVSDVQGYGRQKGHKEVYRGHEYVVNFVRKVKFEIACDDGLAPKLVEVITHAAKTGEGKIGDGKVFVFDLNNAVRIRTGETGSDAL